MSPVFTPLRRLPLVAEDHLVHRRGLVGQLVEVFELVADVVGVEHRVFGGLAQAVGAVGQDVGQRADEHARVAVEGAHAADGLRPVVVPAQLAQRDERQGSCRRRLAVRLETARETAVGSRRPSARHWCPPNPRIGQSSTVLVSDQNRHGQKRLKKRLASHRAGAGTAAAVGRGEGLVQVQVHHVHAEVAGPRLAHQRVHVGAVHVEQRALGVQDVGDLVNLALEDANRRGVGEHQRGGLFVHLPRKGLEIDAALGVGLEILDRVAADGRGGRVGAVGRVGDENLLARIALRLVPCADEQDSRELAMRAGGRLQRDRVHAGDFDQAALQQIDHFENTLRQRFRPVRMRLGQSLDAGDELVHARVVLHGAGARADTFPDRWRSSTSRAA